MNLAHALRIQMLVQETVDVIFIYLLLKSYSKYMIDREDRYMVCVY